jgi:AcrR family transcriptional regulator
MKAKPISAAAAPRPSVRARPAGPESRERLLHAALRLFAAQGFAKTSIREIASSAGVNIAAISYYFGDKAGLYRTLFNEALGCPSDAFVQSGFAELSLREALTGVLLAFLDMLKQDELVQLGTRLHFREMIEPTGMREEKIDTGIRPAHAMLVKLLSRHLGLARPDDNVHRLAFSIIGLGVQMFLTRDVIQAIRPQLLATPAAIDTWSTRMVDYAEAMVAVEAQRRTEVAGKIPRTSVKKTS